MKYIHSKNCVIKVRNSLGQWNRALVTINELDCLLALVTISELDYREMLTRFGATVN